MTAGINIEFVSDVRKFIGGTSDVEGALGKVSDALDDVARDAQKSGDKAAESMSEAGKDMARSTETATEKMEKSFSEVAKAAKSSGKTAGDDLGEHVKRGSKDADEGISSLKENTAQNAKEMGASFQDVGSAIDGLQGLAAEALEGFGPAGVAAGVAVAAGIGVATQALQQAADEANKLTEDATALADVMGDPDLTQRAADLRDRFDEVAKSVSDVRSIWEVWQPRAITTAEDFAAAIQSGAVSAETLMSAFTETDPVKRVQALTDVSGELEKALAKTTKEYQRSDQAQRLAGESDTDRSQRLGRMVEAIGRAQEAVQDETATQQAALEIERALATAKGQTLEQYQAEQKAAEKATETASAYAAALESAADPVSVYQDLLSQKEAAEKAAAEATAAATEDSTDSWTDYAKDVAVSTQDLIDQWNAQAAQAEQFTANLAIIAAAGGQALADDLRAKGPEVAAAVAETIAKSGPEEQQAAIDAYARATGEAAGQALADGLASKSGAWAAAIAGFNAQLGNVRVGVSSAAALDAAGLGKRAGGGTVAAGTPYVVGENAAELFVPGQTGTVLNAAQIAAALGRTGTQIPAPPTRAGQAKTNHISITVNPSAAMNEQALALAVSSHLRNLTA
ncbi:MAG: hypothetical protein L6367_04160 [Cellulomonas sp.]|nr:hypothetical protein [Cellulomonas sp.]